MILVKKYRGGNLSFRTQRGSVVATVKDGFICIDVDPVMARQMRILHKFHAPPLGFSLEEPKKEAVVEKKEKKPAPKKTTRRRAKKS